MDLEEKWVKRESIKEAYIVPVELPFEKGPELEVRGFLEGLDEGKLQIIQLPPHLFDSDFLEDEEIDEQELESIEVSSCLVEPQLPRQEQYPASPAEAGV